MKYTLPTSTGNFTLTMKALKRPLDSDHTPVKYVLTDPIGLILFEGRDFKTPDYKNPTSKKNAAELIGFLTLALGDTDSEWFDSYTPAQMEFCQSFAYEELSLYSDPTEWTTPVIIRMDTDGAPVAIFPTLPGTSDPYTFTAYSHIGQHSAACIEWYYTTRPASLEQAAPLLKELESLGYNLKVYKKFLQSFDKIRRSH